MFFKIPKKLKQMNYLKYYSTIKVTKVTNQNNNHQSPFPTRSSNRCRTLSLLHCVNLLPWFFWYIGVQVLAERNLEQIDAVFTYPYKIILWLFVSLNQAKAICRLDGVLNSSVHKVNWIKWILLVYWHIYTFVASIPCLANNTHSKNTIKSYTQYRSRCLQVTGLQFFQAWAGVAT